jgi:hypothetical protein
MMNPIDFAPRSAARRRIAQLLGRVCIARVPELLNPDRTRLCGATLRHGNYCPDCVRRMAKKLETA